MEKKIVVLDSSINFIFFGRAIVAAEVIQGWGRISPGEIGIMTKEAAEKAAAEFNARLSTAAAQGLKALSEGTSTPPDWRWRKWRPLERAAMEQVPWEVSVKTKTGTIFRRPKFGGGGWEEWEEEITSSRPFGREDLSAYMAERLENPAAAGWVWDLERGLVREVP